MAFLIILCLIVIGFLGYKLYQKQVLDTTERNKLKDEVHDLRNLRQYAEEDLNTVKEKRKYEEYKLEECRKDLQNTLDTYHDMVDNKLADIDATIEDQRQKRQEELDRTLQEKQQYYEKLLQDTIEQCAAQDEAIKTASEEKWQAAMEQIHKYNENIAAAKEKFESIERTLLQYEKERQARTYYTLQIPEEYHNDIDFLLTTVAQKVVHPDIISKLVWSEYVKPAFDALVKRTEIEAKPGIYKITNLDSGKCYIGKSVDVKKRLADHYKSSIGITSIADQAIHHAILNEGIWNWSNEIITYCDKDKLNELEKYYIEFFKAQEFGYNKNAGG